MKTQNTVKAGLGLLCVAFELAAFSAKAADSAELSADGYLNQVLTKNTAVQGATERAQGAKDRAQQESLALAPQLIGQVATMDDKRPQLNPSFSGVRTRGQQFMVGIVKPFSFGLTTKLTYTQSHQNITGATLLPLTSYYQTGPQLEFTQSLFKNGFGREIRAAQDLAEAQALSSHYSENYSRQAQLVQAEQVYWALVFARETVELQRSVFERAQKIYEWSQRRVKMNLADRSDLLQSQAAMEMNRLDLQSALDFERSAALQFNSLRSIDSDSVNEKLAKVDSMAILSEEIPKRADMRDDVKAAREMTRVAEASGQINKEKYLPTVDVFGNVGTGSLKRDATDARTESTDWNHRYFTLGVKVAIPLDFAEVSRSRDGNAREMAGAELNFERKVYEQETEWRDLVIKLTEARKRLELSENLSRIQKEKLTHEQDRLSKGRSTTYQVLVFEQHFAQTEIARIQAQREIITLIQKMKLYRGQS